MAGINLDKNVVTPPVDNNNQGMGTNATSNLQNQPPASSQDNSIDNLQKSIDSALSAYYVTKRVTCKIFEMILKDCMRNFTGFNETEIKGLLRLRIKKHNIFDVLSAVEQLQEHIMAATKKNSIKSRVLKDIIQDAINDGLSHEEATEGANNFMASKGIKRSLF